MSCSCSSESTRLLYACSGAANTGGLADQVARRLALQGKGRMTCLAGIGADLENFLQGARSAAGNVVIDGCPVLCGRKAFERHGIACTSIVLTDHGVEKGKTLIDESVVARMTERCAELMG